MKTRIWAGHYKRLFDLRRPVDIQEVEVDTDYAGLFLAGRKRDTVLINVFHANTEKKVRATILHELIHAEQNGLKLPVDHGKQFKQRCAEIREQTGIDP